MSRDAAALHEEGETKGGDHHGVDDEAEDIRRHGRQEPNPEEEHSEEQPHNPFDSVEEVTAHGDPMRRPDPNRQASDDGMEEQAPPQTGFEEEVSEHEEGEHPAKDDVLGEWNGERDDWAPGDHVGSDEDIPDFSNLGAGSGGYAGIVGNPPVDADAVKAPDGPLPVAPPEAPIDPEHLPPGIAAISKGMRSNTTFAGVERQTGEAQQHDRSQKRGGGRRISYDDQFDDGDYKSSRKITLRDKRGRKSKFDDE